MDQPIQIKGKPWQEHRTNFDRNLAVVIGIDRYENPNIHDLSTPVSDANALADLLENGYGYKPENVLRLVDGQATLSGLRTLLTDTLPNQLKPTEGDRLIFYFAGHGLPKNSKEGPTGYLVPRDAQPDREDSFLPMNELHDALSQLQCHHLLVILDCCFAGTFRWAGSRKLIAVLETIHREHYDRFIRFPAWQVITSSAHDQEALDFVKLSQDPRGRVDDKSHSPFALALLEALQDREPDSEGRRYQNADYTKDGVIAAHELIVYLSDRVSQLSKERQAPGLYPLKREYDKGEFIFVKPDFDPQQLSPAPQLNEENNPYRGLKPFEERHAQFFFGRQKLVEELGDRLAKSRRPLTVVLGISGSGKSSLVKAGLLPHLRQKQEKEESAQGWYILAPLRPGKSPFAELAKAVLPVAHSHLIDRLAQVSFLDATMEAILDPKSRQKPKADSREQPSGEKAFEVTKLAQLWHTATREAKLLLIVDYFQQLQGFCHQPQEQAELSQLHEEIYNALKPLAQTLQHNPESFDDAIAKWSQEHPNTKLLLVIDQLEELITMSQDDRESEKQRDSQEQKEWQRFLSLLRVTLAKYRQQLHVVVTLRSDFEPRFLNSALKAHWKIARFPVRGMNSDELRDAIEGPALKQALYFEPPELVGKLIDEVGQMPGALPLLSFTLSELYIKLYERWTKDKSIDRALRIKDYEELGGVAGALTRRATQEYEALDLPHRETMQRVMLRMLTLEGEGVARRRVPESELVYPDPEENKRVAQVSDRLVKARLLVKGQETGEPYVEPAHDFLVRGWDNLQKWLKEEQKEGLILQRQLTPAAEEWKNNKQAMGFLWDDNPRILLLQQTLKSNDVWLNKLEIEFVQYSLKERDRIDIENLKARAKEELQSNKQLEALLTAVKVGKKLQQFLSTPKVNIDINKDQIEKELRQIIYSVQERNRLEGHNDWLWCVNFSPDGQTIATACRDGTVKLWSYEGKELLDIKAHKQEVIYVCFSPDSQIFATASSDKTVKLWNLEGEEQKTLKGHEDEVWCVSFSPDGEIIATASDDKTIKLWNLEGEELKISWDDKHKDKVRGISFSPDGQLLATASFDKTVKLWSLNGVCQKTFEGDDNGFNSVSFSPDGQLVVAACDDRTIRLWSLDDKIQKILRGHTDWVKCVSFSPNGQLIASSSSDNTIKLWSREGEELKTLKGHQNEIWSISFSPDAQTIASASWDKTVKTWSSKVDQRIVIQGHEQAITSVTFSPNGEVFATGSWDKKVNFWTSSGDKLPLILDCDDPVRTVSFSPNGQMIATGCSSGAVKIWYSQGKLLKCLEEHTTEVISVSFSPDGQTLASASEDTTVKLWDINSLNQGKPIPITLKGHTEHLTSVSFSPDGQTLASACWGGIVKLWSLRGGEEQTPITIAKHDEAIMSVSFSPDGRTIATASRDRIAKLWSLDGKELTTFKGHIGHLTYISFSSDGQIIATTSRDGTVKLWSLDGKELKTLEGHNCPVSSVSFSPNQFNLKIWTMLLSIDYLSSILYLPKLFMVSTDENGQLIIWNLDNLELVELKNLNLDKLLQKACKHLGNYLKTHPRQGICQ